MLPLRARLIRGLGGTVPSDDEPADALPALEYVEEQVHRLVDAQQERLKSLDSRGGVLLGFTSVVIGVVLRPNDPLGPFQAAAGLASFVAAILAVLAIYPQLADGLNPAKIIGKYGASSVDEVRLVLVSTLAAIYDASEATAKHKLRRIRGASILLVVSIALLLVGALAEAVPVSDDWAWLRGTRVDLP